MRSDLCIGVLPERCRTGRAVYAGGAGMGVCVYVTGDGVVTALVGSVEDCVRFTQEHFGCELEPAPIDPPAAEAEPMHYRDVLVNALADRRNVVSADSVLNELHQAGWRVVRR